MRSLHPHDTGSPLPPGLHAAVRDFAGNAVDAVIVLGSGLGGFADTVTVHDRVSTADLPDYPASTIIGHEGRLLRATSNGTRLLLVQGRIHGYEGHDAATTALPARIAAAVGARVLLLTNAAGGLDPSFLPGDLMLITDLLVLPGARRMGLDLQLGAMHAPPLPRPLFSAAILARMRDAAIDAGVRLREGTYGFCAGPTYETRAEIAFFRMAGAHAVGMSTATEIITAAAHGVPVVAISCITNIARTVRQTVSHGEVTIVAAQASERLARLVHAFLRQE
ncbi:MAG: purine-nucleoside phosphorylase [Bacteroidota bacterium]|jgi:purine-nucleoside phosphorylase|nr:purine-nucleoside phosphorylase [Bacteroidota bacterium]